MVDVRELTIPQARAGIKAGRFTAKELTAAFLERIDKLDKGGPNINSTLAISTTVLAEAEALDRHFEQNGKLKGKLHGIPILVKDQADVKGLVSTYGSAVAKHNVADQDATIITKLKEAGALILGKTSMAEWATAWFSANGATNYTFTKNPYNLSHDVGASSGGSGAAVAASLAICAVGEDTGGSIRVPSSFCSLVGIRTTPGLVSRHGFCPLIKDQDAPGPMAKTVTDCALLLDCMAGFDPKDEYTAYAARSASLGLPKGGSYAANLDAKIIKSSRIGVVRQLFGKDADPYCRAVNSVIKSSMGKLEEVGTTFVDIHIDDLQYYLDFGQIYFQTSRHDINTFLATKPHLPQDIASILPETSEKSFLQMICSVAHGPKNPSKDPTYADRLLLRDEFRRRINVLITTNNLDALVFPDVQVPPPRISDAAEERFIVNGVEDFPTNTFLASIARLPAISVPAGFTEDGLPVGMELVGLEYQEQHLLELAYGVESLVQGRTCPPEPVDA
ncbi:Amidase [Fusarium sp. LHS14.1]|nr:Amidase [Fusarium sp. LHS14.1]